jgi:hypothetical protein
VSQEARLSAWKWFSRRSKRVAFSRDRRGHGDAVTSGSDEKSKDPSISVGDELSADGTLRDETLSKLMSQYGGDSHRSRNENQSVCADDINQHLGCI